MDNLHPTNPFTKKQKIIKSSAVRKIWRVGEFLMITLKPNLQVQFQDKINQKA